MGRHIGPVCRLCRREGLKLFLKGTRCDTPKCAVDRREGVPGMHQFRRSKASEYSIRLREKQKVKRYYGDLRAPVPQVLRAGQPPARATPATP